MLWFVVNCAKSKIDCKRELFPALFGVVPFYVAIRQNSVRWGRVSGEWANLREFIAGTLSRCFAAYCAPFQELREAEVYTCVYGFGQRRYLDIRGFTIYSRSGDGKYSVFFVGLIVHNYNSGYLSRTM